MIPGFLDERPPSATAARRVGFGSKAGVLMTSPAAFVHDGWPPVSGPAHELIDARLTKRTLLG